MPYKVILNPILQFYRKLFYLKCEGDGLNPDEDNCDDSRVMFRTTTIVTVESYYSPTRFFIIESYYIGQEA